ncbi:serine O-acetyltransferase [Eionea flava]
MAFCNIHANVALIKNIHRYQRAAGNGGVLSSLSRALAAALHKFWSVLTGSDIDRDASISIDLQLPHPNGVIMHRDAVVGQGCMIMQQVTLGQTGNSGAPTVGNNVYIGAGAKLLGDITVGDGAKIGANAVVLKDVPENATAVGVPARIILS